MDFLIATDDLHNTSFREAPAQEPGPGEALLSVSAFGLTSNNITYALFGERMSYWKFFPAEEGWGRMPVWGFADVSESRAAGLQAGTRVYGYLPPSSTLLIAPGRVSDRGFRDSSPHRAELPAAYNRYMITATDPIYTPQTEDAQMLLRPLFFTSWLIDDFLGESEFFGASTVVLSSASSKTSSGLAYLLSKRGGADVVGLTSARGAPYTRELGVYDHVITYDDADSLPQGRTVYVDMAGDASVRDAVHGHYRDELAQSIVIGATHHEQMGAVPDTLPGPRPRFFFAPDRVAKRSTEWGPEGLETRIAEDWGTYVSWAEGWLKVIHEQGPDALRGAYLDLLDGRIDPSSAHVLSL